MRDPTRRGPPGRSTSPHPWTPDERIGHDGCTRRVPRVLHASKRPSPRVFGGPARPGVPAALHADRTARRDRHHRDPDRPAAARPSRRSARRPPGCKCQNNLKQMRARPARLPRRQQQVPRRGRTERRALYVALRGTAPLHRAGPALQAVGLRDAVDERAPAAPRSSSSPTSARAIRTPRTWWGSGSGQYAADHLRRQRRHAALPAATDDVEWACDGVFFTTGPASCRGPTRPG